MNKSLLYNGICIGFCSLSIMGLTINEHNYRDIYSFSIDVLKNRYFMLMGVMGANLAMIGNELLIGDK
jgi:hypothetical protein